ncbi:MAG: hypothetical protein NDI60_06115 [Elusimicrobiales bacterium]|nr:hypothetical protein [Elusimicrobiales bacterium]
MLKRALLALFAAASLSSPAYSQDFSLNGAAPLAGVRQVSLELPAAVPAPAAKAAGCKPFLMEIAVGGVSESVAIERACTAQNDTVWALRVDRRGAGVHVRVTSLDDPARRALVEKRVKEMLLNGMTGQDADLVVGKVGPLLKAAAAADGAERAGLLQEARLLLAGYLARP